MDSPLTSIELLPASPLVVAPARKPHLPSILVVTFGTCVGVVVALAVGYHHESTERNVAYGRVEHTLEVVQALDRLQMVMVDAETGARGFLLTRNDASLKPYVNAKQEYPAALENIIALVADNPAQQQRLAKLGPLLDGKWRILDAAVATMRATGELSSVVLALPDAAGRVAMDTIRAVLGQMRAEERELLSQRKARYEQVKLAESLTIIGAAALALVSLFFLYRAMLQAFSHRRHAEEALERLNSTLAAQVAERTARLTSLNRHLVRVSEEERRRIGRELHDELGANLSAAIIDISAVLHHLKQSTMSRLVPPAERALESLRATSDLSRRIIADLRPLLLEEFGLAKALEAYCDAFEAKTAIKCERVLESDLPQLEEETSIALFRIVQESLSNVAKYARAATVRVTLARSDHVLRVSVEDDGVGVTDAALAKTHAHGVAGMRERAYELGADFRIGAGLGGHGTGVHVAVPLMADRGADIAG